MAAALGLVQHQYTSAYRQMMTVPDAGVPVQFQPSAHHGVRSGFSSMLYRDGTYDRPNASMFNDAANT